MSDNSVTATEGEEATTTVPLVPDEAETNKAEANEDAPLQQLELTIKDLNDRMAQFPELQTDVETILQEHLQPPITPTSLSNLGIGLEMYLGFETANRLIDLLSDEKLTPSMLDKLEGVVPQSLLRWVRRLYALYNKYMVDANIAWKQNPDGWSYGDRRASFDYITGKWWVSLRIEKFNGSVVFLEDAPYKMMALAQTIIDTISIIPPENLKDILRAPDLVVPKNAIEKLLAIIEADEEPEEPVADPAPAESAADGAVAES